ncbi:PAS domain-containing protein [Ferruginibacter sp. SUN106]|uniref:PAS domain-containing protein n=1 Tax=Ferruginibacter sp. SUN106 TaxID=2978348 RepID=UPI003D369BC6
MKKNTTIVPGFFGREPFFCINADGCINDVNHAAEKISGKPAVELGGSYFKNLFTEPQKAEEMLHRVLTEGAVSNCDLSFNSNNEESNKLVLLNAFCHNEGDNKEKIVFAIASPPETEEGRFQKILKEIADYKYALDESSIVAITDQKGIITYVNDNFCSISKFNRTELIGMDHEIINSGHHPKEFIRNLWVTIARGKIWRGEIKNKAKDGTFYWVDTTIVPFVNQDNKPYKYLAIRADITSRKVVEENLETSLKETSDYKYALDESSIVAITDQKGIIKYANYNFCKISKFSYEELIGKDHRIINSGHHPKEFIRNLWVTIANGKIWRGELKNKAKDGTFYWVDTTIIPFLDDNGKPYQYVAIRADITQRKQVEEEIIVLNEELEKRVKERTEEIESFSYSVSHDLRGPLRAVNGYAKILEEDYNNIFDTEGKRLLGEIQYNAKKMGTLIDDLLSFARLGRKEVQGSVIDMNKLVATVIRDINQNTTHHAEIKIKKLLPVKADYVLLEHVMNNLIVNAIKYSSKKERPVVEIKSKRGNREMIYSVIDNGVGFEMEYKHKLFGVFQRLHSAEDFPGTGVGLAIAYRIIEKHNGKIWAVSTPGKGAIFNFSLPEINHL